MFLRNQPGNQGPTSQTPVRTSIYLPDFQFVSKLVRRVNPLTLYTQ